ncbi:AAHS family benzoate transporter-like MFS transporter [Pseudonocardia hierapolitana]|uniref:AAHS family benzoate transporter-like MFS transporter n=1 Tax=Pseudonocardia hierapolitana TaxID=1128676 RepID=A0A561SJZ7_9PSEU|nr:MFS transporter [Pseudonocardia hierapolitana]TWF75180.1 AAHS family benzoate transporter-like MFS transporter [Pseudonocardia hierapolitana]
MPAPPTARRSARPWVVVALGFAAIVFDGYDLIVYGSAVPALLADPQWQLTPPQVGAIGSYALLGMFVGAVGAGALTDRFGRRRMFLAALAWFSVMMLAVAAAPTPELLGLARFAAGLGFGGIAPIAIALVVEWAPPRRRNLLNAVMLCGFPIGGVLAALAGIALLEQAGFRTLFALGALPLVTLLPLAAVLLPESPSFAPAVRARGARDRALLRGRAGVALALFALANVAGFLLVYGLNTWLPQLMRQAGYALGSAIAFLLVFNIGAVAGGLAGSALADRYGSRWVATGAFAAGVVSIGLLSQPLPPVLLYLLIAVAGAASVGTQIVVFGYVALHYDDAHRATALGISTGIGRLGAVAGPLVGGYLLASGLGLGWNFAAFAAVALVGALTALAVPPRSTPAARSAPVPVAAPAS